MLDPADTIVAVSSPPGPGQRGLVRLTGARAWALALDGFATDESEARPVARAEVRMGRLTVDGLRPTLPAMIALWPGPRTYTGQPLAEIHTVGAPPLVQLVLAQRLAGGARLAEPGEFTLRAFLAGRIDLTRAEAVLGVIDARDPAQLEAALKQLAGGLAGPIARLRDRLLDVLAHLEAGLDFVEEPDVDPLARSALASELAGAADEVDALADRLRGRDRPEGLPAVVLSGPPNAGKSRLFNALTGHDRALVSAQAGTTRDYLCAPCLCDGLVVELIDTAGAEAASGPIVGRAQALRASQAARADLILDCRSLETDAETAAKEVAGRPSLVVWTKSDLGPAPAGSTALSTSAATGSGLDRLRRAIADALRERAADGNAPAGTGPRCRDGLRRAGRSLRAAAETLALGGGDELVAIDIHQAVDDLGRVVGAVVTDEILDRIFRRFCIGK